MVAFFIYLLKKMSKKINYIEGKYGRLTPVLEVERSIGNRRRFLCKCDCGNEVTVQSNHLTSGGISSCGCFHSEVRNKIFTKHGESSNGKLSAEYITWSGMKQRVLCVNKSNKNYKNYAGRGITICDRWRASFENFLIDMGRRPSEFHSLERVDNNGNYEPSNCSWETKTVQASNRRSNVWLEYDGQRMILNKWALKLNTSSNNINYFLRRGKQFKDIVEYYKKQMSYATNYSQ